jgi:hypothetical protein
MSPTRSGYKKLRLETVETLENRLHRSEPKLMGDENKYDGARYPFKLFLKEALARQRNTMMEKFT